MEKRLIDAYDHMTMPEDCARKIEARMTAELGNRKPGRYTKTVSPDTSRRDGRGIAAACLLLILAAGGVILGFWLDSSFRYDPQVITADKPAETEARPEREYFEGFLNFVLKVLPDGNYALVSYDGQEEIIEVPAGRGRNQVTEIGVGKSVIRYGEKVTTIQIPETVRKVQENAFADCPALEAVFFEGDAPPEAEGIFEGSENVTVYYRKGTEGWGDTWCGRKTGVYSHEYIPLGIATVEDRIPAQFRTVLSGEPVRFYGNGGEMTVTEYCTARWGNGASADAFTLADMDRDGICELVFSVRNAEGGMCGYLVLRLDETVICGYTLRNNDLYDLTKDGSFYCASINGDSRLYFQGKDGYSIETEDFSMQDKPLAQWHVYPCQGSALVLDSYRYASETGAGASPGYGYYYFEDLAYGTMANDWSQIQYWLNRQMICREEGNMAYAYDSDAPGCVFYGTLTGEGEQRKFSSIGYYICDETGEYRAEVFGLDGENPVYTIDPLPNDRGREVETAEEMMAYLGHAPYYDSIGRDVQQIAELLDRFVGRYSEHDTEGMQDCMAEDAWELSSYPFTGEVSVVNFGTLPDRAVAVGESWHTNVELLETGETKATYHLAIALVKQADGWKIQSYSIEKQ